MKVSLFQGILLGVFGIGALIGLFVFSTYSSSGGGSAGVGTVVIWGVLPKDAMDAVLKASADLDQSLKDVSYTEHDEAHLQGDLATAIATGNAPDLILISQEDLVSVGKLIDPIPSATLSSRTFASAFVQESQLFGSSLGAYGVPFLVDPLVLYENQTILSSVGIPKPPSTWEALSGLVPKVATLTPAGRITRSLIPLGTYNNVHDALGILSALFLQTGVSLATQSASGYRVVSLGNDSASGNGVPPGQSVLRFYTQFADPSKVSYTWDDSLPDSQQAFLSGDTALYLGYASEATYFKQANPNLQFDVAPFPQPATATSKITYGRVYAFAPVHGAKNTAGGYQASALLTNLPEQQAAATATGLAPASLTAIAAGTGDSFLSVAYASALYAKGWLSPAPSDTDRIFSLMIQSVISGGLPLQAALANAERSLSALLQ